MAVRSETLTPRQQRALASRNHILETALRLFARRGFDGTSTRQIAQEAGVAEGLIFHYFPTKEHLLMAMMDTRHSYRGEMRVLLESAAGRPAVEVLRQLATELLSRFRSEAESTLVMFNTSQSNPKVGAALREFVAEDGVGVMAAYLRARIEAGELRPDLPVESSAFMFLSSLATFFFIHHTLPDEQWNERAATYAADMTRIWFEGART